MSSECRGVDKGTLDTICTWRVNSRSAVIVHYENPRVVICDEGVLAVDLCTTGPLYKLDCPWLNPYLFVPRRMVCCQPGATDCCRCTHILLGTGGNSFNGWVLKGMCPN